MVAFAANSLLNRMALSSDAIGPGAFASARVASGAIVLAVLLCLRDRSLPRLARPDPVAVAGLTVYLLGFSYAYVAMDAGLGALILFGGVQITMFAGALIEGATLPARRWLGMAMAFFGLVIVSWPTASVAVTPRAVLLMSGAAVGWGVYSLVGRRVSDPVRATGWNFVYSLPLVLLAVVVWPDGAPANAQGVALAIVSGAMTSALGYALWYALLPSLGATRGALAQLSVPAIAMAMGTVFLGEQVTLLAALSAGLILGGVAVGVMPGAAGST